MALVVKDRVKEVTTTTGTSNLTLGGAVYGFQSFSVIGNGNTTYYGIYDSATGDWEVGVGTYSTTGPTLSRDTVLESSNSGSKVVFGAGTKDVFVTYPAERSVYLDAAGSAVSVLDIGTLGVSTANISTANITAGTISTTPTASNDLVNKTYVDAIAAQGISYHAPVKYEVPNTTGNLNATYNNGASGVGATLTNAGTQVAFAPDGPTASIGDRILVYNQTNAYENGVYEVSVVGSGSTNWVLTRAADADSYGVKDPNSLGAGDAFYVTSGNTGAGETYVCNTAGTITFGTTAITFAQVASAQVYSAGTGLTLSNLQFSITPVGTAGTYGSASSVPVFTTNASGQITSVANTGIAISAGAVSGLAPSATTDTTNASNITSGTLGSARLAGFYTGITGVGTLTAGTWTANTIGAAYGGTGLTSYTVGDILYADGATSLAKLADVAAGSALISGGVGTAPLWGKIGLQTHVSGTLQVTNGGTGATDATGARSNLGLVIGTDVPSPTGTGASGTWGINITGNAATATTATTSTTATQVSNSVTFNNSGTGAASGNGFNGSSALTVSYNTIGAPSTTGTNASGTWGINITGNAGSATVAANYLPLAGGTLTGPLTESSTNDQALILNKTSGTAWKYMGFSYQGTRRFYFGLNSSFEPELGVDNGATFRVLGNMTVGGNQVLTSGNYNSYAPTLTGGGASGTWSINITGNAATVTNGLTTSNYSSYSTFTGAVTSGGNNGFRNDVYYVSTRNPIWCFGNATSYGLSYFQGSSGLGGIDTIGIHPNGTPTGSGSVLMVTSSYTQSLGSLRAPLFYDSDNTSYFVDPASTSVVNVLRGSTIQHSNSNTAIVLDSPTYLQLRDPSGTTRIFLGNSNDPGNYYDNATHYFRNASSVVNFTINDSYGQHVSSLRAPIFYDSDNTGYYVDPAGVSNINNLLTQVAVSNNVNGLRNINPGGGSYVTQASSVSGAIRITLPSTVYPMIRFTVKVYTYDGLPFEISCGGHTSGGIWYNTFAYMTTQSRPALNVRFTYGGGNVYVYIGELGSSWSYPQVFITDVQVGYTDYSYTQWDDGWAIAFDSSSYQNISSTHTVYPPTSSSNNTNAAYASILYDANNTGWYCDPNSRSRLSTIDFGDGGYYIGAGDWGMRNTTPYGWIQFGPANTSHAHIYTDRSNFYFNAQLQVNGGSNINTSDIRANIFYDNQNTGFYVDPASTTYLQTLILSGASYFRPNNWIQLDGSYGLYWPNNFGAHFHANDLSSYTQLATRGSKNGYGGIYDQASGVNGIMYDGGGYGGVYREANGRWYWYYHIANDCMGIGTSSTSSTYSLYLNKGVYAQSRIDATIFYDTNNTSYYVDPNGTSYVNNLLANSGTFYGATYFQSNQNTSGSSPPLQAYSNNGSGAIMSFHRGGYYAINMGLDSDNVFRIGGWSASYGLFQMDMSGNLTMSGNVTAYSDERMKTDWVSVPGDFITRLALIKSGTYTRTDSGMRQAGSSAQDWRELLPEVVSEDAEGTLGLAYGNAAVVACVELAKSVVALRAEINALRAQ